MNKTLPLIFIALVTSSCGPIPLIRDIKAASTFIAMFESEAANRGVKTTNISLITDFTDLSYGDHDGYVLLGICTHTNEGVPWIRLDWDRWKKLSDTRKEVLVFHELGHCFRGLGHTNGGIMNAVMISDQDYLNNRESYINDLF